MTKMIGLNIEISISEGWISLGFPLYYIDDFIDSDFLGSFKEQYFCVYDEDATFEVALVENQIPFRSFLTRRSRSQIAVIKVSDLRRIQWHKNNNYVYGGYPQGALAVFLADQFPIKGAYLEALYPEWGNKIDAFYNPSLKAFFYDTDDAVIWVKDMKMTEAIVRASFLNYLADWLKAQEKFPLMEKVNLPKDLGLVRLEKINEKSSMVIFSDGIFLEGNLITIEVWVFEKVIFKRPLLGKGIKYVFDISNSSCRAEGMAEKEHNITMGDGCIRKARF